MEHNRPSTDQKPWGTIVSVVTALLYGVSPIDLIPDLIPILGLADDLTVALTLGTMAIALYIRFMNNTKNGKNPQPAPVNRPILQTPPRIEQ